MGGPWNVRRASSSARGSCRSRVSRSCAGTALRYAAVSRPRARYEAAVAAFEDLAPDLAAGTAKAVPQMATEPSYFGLRDRPRGACVVSFSAPAATVVNLVRALDFGPARNPLGLAKVRVGEGFVA